MSEDCGTGCINEEHLIICPDCGAKYHIGILHHCPTSESNHSHGGPIE